MLTCAGDSDSELTSYCIFYDAELSVENYNAVEGFCGDKSAWRPVSVCGTRGVMAVGLLTVRSKQCPLQKENFYNYSCDIQGCQYKKKVGSGQDRCKSLPLPNTPGLSGDLDSLMGWTGCAPLPPLVPPHELSEAPLLL